uniref:Chaperone DnaJ C-terminal domain-containing protein n=1 Tax=Ditylenchus dipsaci TaxID=166011 RepID=A0A915CWI0_9BILA
MGPGMITQMATHCDGCAGQGEIINEKDKCKKCNARKTVQEQKILEVKITPGMRDNQKIVFYGEGDQEPDIEPGDKRDDLFMRKKISLNDAICGYSAVIQHLDGRHLVMSSIPGEVIHPESIRGVLGEGMPKPDSTERGNLYVVFDVEFPENHFLPEAQLKKLESLLPPRPLVKVPVGEDVEEVSLAEFDPRRHDQGGGGSGREPTMLMKTVIAMRWAVKACLMASMSSALNNKSFRISA